MRAAGIEGLAGCGNDAGPRRGFLAFERGKALLGDKPGLPLQRTGRIERHGLLIVQQGESRAALLLIGLRAPRIGGGRCLAQLDRLAVIVDGLGGPAECRQRIGAGGKRRFALLASLECGGSVRQCLVQFAGLEIGLCAADSGQRIGRIGLERFAEVLNGGQGLSLPEIDQAPAVMAVRSFPVLGDDGAIVL